MIKHITFFSLHLVMTRKPNAKIEATVRIYLIPKNEFKILNGKPMISDEYLVYESKKKGIMKQGTL